MSKRASKLINGFAHMGFPSSVVLGLAQPLRSVMIKKSGPALLWYTARLNDDATSCAY